jgi:hypothetical protein
MCFNHSVAWHQGQTCAQYDSVKAHGDPDYQKTADWIKKNTKPCPKCRRSIQKGEMCFHMTCKSPIIIVTTIQAPPQNRTWLTNDRLAMHARVLLGVPGGLEEHRSRAWPVQCRCPRRRVSVPHERDRAHADIGRDICSRDAATTSMMGRRSVLRRICLFSYGTRCPTSMHWISSWSSIRQYGRAENAVQAVRILMKKQCCFTDCRLPPCRSLPCTGIKAAAAIQSCSVA